MSLYTKSLIYVSPFWLILLLLFLLQSPFGALVYFAMPGLMISAMISGNVHDYSLAIALLANIFIYYLLVLSVLYFRRERAKRKATLL